MKQAVRRTDGDASSICCEFHNIWRRVFDY